MLCPACGSELTASAKFCTNCGNKLPAATESVAAAEAPAAAPPIESPSSVQPTQPEQPAYSAEAAGQSPAQPAAQPNPQVPPAAGYPPGSGQVPQTTAPGYPPGHAHVHAGGQQAAKITNDYFSFLWNALKRPGETAAEVKAPQLWHGIITMGIFAVIVPLVAFLVAMLRVSFMNFGPFSPSLPMGQLFLGQFILPVLTYAFTFALIIVTLFVTANLLKASHSFSDITARFGAYIVIPTAIAIFASLIAAFAPGFSTIISGFSMLGVGLGILLTYKSFEIKETKLDSYYIGIILVSICYLIYRLLGLLF